MFGIREFSARWASTSTEALLKDMCGAAVWPFDIERAAARKFATWELQVLTVGGGAISECQAGTGGGTIC